MKLYLLFLLTLALPTTQIQTSAPGPKKQAAAPSSAAAASFKQPPRAIDDIPSVSPQVAQTMLQRDESRLEYHLTGSKFAKELQQIHEHFLLARQAEYHEVDIQQRLKEAQQKGCPTQIADLEPISHAHSCSVVKNLELEIAFSNALKNPYPHAETLLLKSQRNVLQSKLQLARSIWAEETRAMQNRLNAQEREIQTLKEALAAQQKKD